MTPEELAKMEADEKAAEIKKKVLPQQRKQVEEDAFGFCFDEDSETEENK